MKRVVIALLFINLIASSLQDECHFIFNNVHNGYRYTIDGTCTITEDKFVIKPTV